MNPCEVTVHAQKKKKKKKRGRKRGRGKRGMQTVPYKEVAEPHIVEWVFQ